MSQNNSQSIEVFLSYSHKDKDFKEEIEKYLITLKRKQVIATWSDKEIPPGSKWKENIEHHIKTAKIIILLISQDFLNSYYCYEKEMEVALQRHREGKACVLPVLIRPCMWDDTPLEEIQVLPDNAIPITNWTNSDDAYVNIAQGIKRAIEEFKTRMNGEQLPTKDAIDSYIHVPETTIPTTIHSSVTGTEQQYFTYTLETLKLNDLGLYKGISSDNFGCTVNVETSIILLLRLFGLELEAKAVNDEDAVLAKFSDAS